jgi:hypothetical protein
MPWEARESAQCPKDKPWGVFNKQTGRKVACHESRDSAMKQVRALYANVKEMSELHSNTYVVPMQFAEQRDNLLWLEALPAKTWHTLEFGEVPVTQETLQRLVDHFYGKVRGQEIATDFDHGRDRAKGNKASGWIREAEIRGDSLWLGVEPTPLALAEIQNNEWKYFSLEWDDFMHPETQEYYQDVIIGGGFTNRPIAKGMVPINFSELYQERSLDDSAKTFASKKPYGNVTYADPGYQKDGKSRYPIDTEEHIRAAWSYINQKENAAKYTPDQLSKVKAKIKAAMKRIGAEVKSMAEVTNESKEMEHSEPGTGSPPAPRTDEDGSDDKSIESGSRRDTPPIAEDKVDNELDAKLREALGLGEDADIVKAVSDIKAEVEPLRAAAKAMSERKKFAEQYPDEAAELDRLKKKNRENEAKAFAERYERFVKKDGDKEVTTAFGLSALSLQKVEEVHKKFSEGSATAADLADILDTIGEHGIVDYSERGTSRRNAEDVKTEDPGKAFAEKVTEIQNEDKIPYGQAIDVAAKRHPTLFAEYRKQATGGREE